MSKETYSVHKVDVNAAFSFAVESRSGEINAIEITHEPKTVIKDLSFHVYATRSLDVAGGTDGELATRGEELATEWITANAGPLHDAVPGSLKINWTRATNVSRDVVKVAHPWAK